MLSQLSWMDSLPQDNATDSYFGALLAVIGAQDRLPAWPDAFGQALREWVAGRLTRPIRILSLFAGGGGLDIGFHDAGFMASQMVEIDPRYVETLRHNAHEGRILEGAQPLCIDIRDYNPPEGLQVDFIIGGPPCQTFSAAGRRAAGVSGTDDPRGTLFQEYVRILQTVQPKGFLFENVYGITGAQGGRAWKEIVSGFTSAGYNVSARILDAADYGVPQHRERLIIVGLREGQFAFPRPTHGPDSRDGRPFYMAGLATREVEDKKPGPIRGRYGHLLEDIPPGLNYSFYTEEMGHPKPVFSWRSKFSDLLYKADPDKPVRTIKAQGGQYTGPFHWENRPFSTGEMKRLQTFPDRYVLQGGRQVAIQQIGNSVPPQLGRIMAIAVLDQVFGIRFPFHLDYLAPGEQLGFRQRKRHLTKHYRQIAYEAITRQLTALALEPSEAERAASGPSVESGEQWRAAYIGPDFEWRFQRGTDASLISNVEYMMVQGTDNLEFKVREPKAQIDGPATVIEIRPSSRWKLQYETVRLVIASASPLVFTAAWKAFETYLLEEGIKADLVQLNSYYQYKPKMSIRVVAQNSLLESGTNALEWGVVRHVLEGRGTRRIIAIQDLKDIWSLSTNGTIKALIQLRTLGYEVRSAYTNGQIPDQHFLIPYAFPTLTPLSVQLRKTLFPDSVVKKVMSSVYGG